VTSGKVTPLARGNEPDARAQPPKVAPFAGGNEAAFSKKLPQAIFSNKE